MSGRVGPLKPSFINTYSLDFDGVDDYVSLDSPNYPNAISFSAWFKTTNTSTQTIWSALDNSVQKHFLRISNTQFRLRLTDSAGALLTLDNTLTTQDGNWHHVAFTTDGTTTTDGVVVYFDGVALSNKGTLGNSGLITTNKNNIGTYAATTWNFNGSIDEVSLYDSELSASQISDIYNSGTPTDLTSLNPIAWYRMGDNGAYKSPQWLIPNNENKDKVSNYSMDFDGVNDYIDCGNDNSINISGDLTLSAWVFIPSYPGDFYGIFSKIDGSTRNYEVLIRPTGQISFYTSNTLFTTSTNSVSLNTWTHVLVTVNSGVAGGVKFYFNGVLDVTTGTQTVVAQTHNLNLGRRSTGDFDLNGKLDDVSIFPRVLTSGEISTISTEPTDLTPLNPSAWWKMGENSTFVYGANPDGTWTIPDEVGPNDGTSNNLMADSARVGSAPSSSNNALSFNMDLIDRVPDTP